MPTLYMLIGIAGSGKSTVAQTLNCPIVSSDTIRAELFGDESIQSNPAQVFNVVHSRINDYLENAESVVYDATNLSAKHRKRFLSTLSDDVYTVAIVVATDLEVALEQNANRERNVPADVIRKMYRTLQFPSLSEGFDEIRIHRNPNNKSILDDLLQKTVDFNQENPHHTETLDVHLTKAKEYASSDLTGVFSETTLKLAPFAARVHDIGKPDTKTFIKPNGKVDTVAHYYNHENVGAYKLACLPKPDEFSDDEWKKIILVVKHHMDGYKFIGDTDYVKVGEVYGEEMQDILMIVHTADLAAH